jgi:hypothetical protein
MSRDELCHLEHANLTLAVKYRPEGVVRVDHGSFLFVLTTVSLDVVPKLLGKLRTWQRLRPDDSSELIVRLDWSHEGGIWFAFGRFLFGFRHRG